MKMDTNNKEAVKKYTETLIQMTNDFCDQYLDEEYKALCEKMIRKMSRKRTVPFLSGKIEIWAAGVVYAIGRINFLFDKSVQPYISHTDLCDYFGTLKSTTSQRAKVISDMFKLSYYNSEFSTARMRESNPFAAFLNGMPVPFSVLSPELQEIARLQPEKPLILWSMKDEES
jgi:hypothetical protein